MVKFQATTAIIIYMQIIISLSIRITEINDIVIVIISQPTLYHDNLAEELVEDLQNQSTNVLHQNCTYKRLSDLQSLGSWTIIPLIATLQEHYDNKWIVFVEERTRINLSNLFAILSKYNSSEPRWIGYGLYDSEATIIHHFAYFGSPEEFAYPNLASGFAISNGLINQLAQILTNKSFVAVSDFSIDAAHELALFIWQKGKGTVLQHDERFCIQNASADCATYLVPFKPCDGVLPRNVMEYAVKTCEKFHQERVPKVKHTWGKHVNIKYFSDKEDKSIPTIEVETPNVEQGHCQKTKDIMQYLSHTLKSKPVQWIVIADDDTIMSVGRLSGFLSCFNASQPMVIGQRYGYNVLNSGGFNYVTGGGGIIISRPAFDVLATAGNCECPSATIPDDMYIFGVCLLRLDIPIIHSPMFHQARPPDYARDYLASDLAISFHKHWMIDPIKVYQNWFQESDEKFVKQILSEEHTHDDL